MRCLRTRDEEADGPVLEQTIGRWQEPQVRQREGRHDELVLAREMERRPARDQHTQAGRGHEQLGDDGGGGDDLLEVIQQQQQLLLPQVVLQALQ